jgi:hypothetical protein
MRTSISLDLEHLLVWIAFIGIAWWTIFCAFTYALMGGWGGTPRFDAFFLLGYAAYGLLLSFEYFFYGRARFLPWLSGERPVRDFFLLLFFFSLPVAWYLIYFSHSVELTTYAQLCFGIGGILVFLIFRWNISRPKTE